MDENTNTSDSGIEVPATTESVEQDSSVQETPQTDASQEEPQVEESFFDPKSVPPELMPAYKQMQGDYTRKTQAIAQERKEAEALKAKAEQFAKYEHLVPVFEEMLSSKQTQQVNPEMEALKVELKGKGYSDEAIDLAILGASFTLKQFEQKTTTEREAERLNIQIDQASKVDPRLSDSTIKYTLGDGTETTFGAIVEEMVSADPNWRKDPVVATKKAIAKLDALIGKAKTEGKEELSNSARSKARQFPQQGSSPQTAADTSQPMSFADAAKQAKQELGM